MDPSALRFTTTHEWVHLDGGVATVGLSKFAVDQLTDLIMIDLPDPGATVAAGKSFGEVESVKAVSDLYSPVSGEVLEVNSAVKDDVQLLATDPYTRGWLLKVKLDPGSPTADLIDFESYGKKVAEDVH